MKSVQIYEVDKVIQRLSNSETNNRGEEFSKDLDEFIEASSKKYNIKPNQVQNLIRQFVLKQ